MLARFTSPPIHSTPLLLFPSLFLSKDMVNAECATCAPLLEAAVSMFAAKGAKGPTPGGHRALVKISDIGNGTPQYQSRLNPGEGGPVSGNSHLALTDAVGGGGGGGGGQQQLQQHRGGVPTFDDFAEYNPHGAYFEVRRRGRSVCVRRVCVTVDTAAVMHV